MTKKKPAAKAAAPKEIENTTAPVEVVVPPEEATEPVSVEAEKPELMQVAGKPEKEDPRPLGVIAASMSGKQTAGKVVFVTKSKDQAIEILANGNSYKPYPKDGVFVWEVPEADVEMFSKHSHVMHGKIVQAVGK